MGEADLTYELKTIDGVEVVEITKPKYVPEIEIINLDDAKREIASLEEMLLKYQTALGIFSK